MANQETPPKRPTSVPETPVQSAADPPSKQASSQVEVFGQFPDSDLIVSVDFDSRRGPVFVIRAETSFEVKVDVHDTVRDHLIAGRAQEAFDVIITAMGADVGKRGPKMVKAALGL